MPLAAIDDIEDALAASKQFLLPFDASRWLRLAVIAFFVGGAGGGTSGGGGSTGGDGGGGSVPPVGELPDLVITETVVLAALAVVALLLVLGLVYAAVGAVMEFVLVESLRREAVHLRRYARRYWRAGLRLFGFRLGASLLAVAGVAVVLGGAFLAGGGVDALQTPLRLLPAFLVALPLVVLISLATALVLGLTTDFVVPVMLLEGTTVLGGWRRFWPTLRADWKEYVVYVLVAFVLRLGVGLLFGIVIGVFAVVLLLPLGAIGLGVYVAGGGQLGLLALAALGGLGLVALAILVVVSAVLGVPVVTYFRYYALLVLGDTEPEFDVVPDRRAAIRTEAAE